MARRHGGFLPSHGTTWGISTIILELAKTTNSRRAGFSEPSLDDTLVQLLPCGFHGQFFATAETRGCEALDAVFRHKVCQGLADGWTVVYWVADEQGQNVISIDLPR